jgi:CubicO group peptidase (beta-lactamase class C family)
MMRIAPHVLAVWFAIGCTSSTSPGDEPWSAVDAAVARAVAANRVTGLGLSVYDDRDQLVFSKMYGDFAPDRRVAVASASKLVSGMVLLDLVAKGRLSLDTTTAAILGWTGPEGAITLRQLLSFTSGLAPENDCTGIALATLAQCADAIRATGLVAPPGTRFDYGGSHLQVAGRMAEVVTAQSWNALFRQTLTAPLGLPADVEYYTGPRQLRGTTNPLVAGGLRASMQEYAALLAVAYHRGSFGSLTLATPALFDLQAREPFPAVSIGNSPFRQIGLPYRYGLSAWLECETPASGCAAISSPGAFGWTPWLDREAGYYAIIGTEISDPGSGVVAFSVSLAQELKPLIRAALAP